MRTAALTEIHQEMKTVGKNPNRPGPIGYGDKTKGRKYKTGITMNDKRSALQHVAKNTKQGMVDVAAMHEPLRTIFGTIGPKSCLQPNHPSKR